MQNLRHLATGDAKAAGAKSHPLPAGRWLFLMLVVKGTTDTGQTLGPEDVGRIRIQRDGDQIQGASFDFYHGLSNLIGGYAHATTPTAGATRITAFIPFYLKGIRNAIDVRNAEEVDVYLDFDTSALGTAFGSNAATYELYGFAAPGVPERYELRIEEQDVVASGAGRYQTQLNGENIGALYLRDGSSVVNSLFLEIDDEVAVDNIDDAALLDVTTFTNRIEAAGSGIVELHQAPGGTIAETRNRNANISVEFSGAGTLEIWKARVIPSDRAAQSIDNVQARLRAQVSGNIGRPTARPRGAR